MNSPSYTRSRCARRLLPRVGRQKPLSMQMMLTKALKKRGFLGFCGLLFPLLLASGGWAQTIEFLPGAPSVYENGGASGTNISVFVVRTPATGTATVQYATFDGTA